MILLTAAVALALAFPAQAADARASRTALYDAPGPDAAGASAGSQSSTRRRGGRVTLTGRLTGEGVECQAFRSDAGKLYTLTGDLRGFKAGDRVRVVGRVAEVSTCMQGATLAVESVRRARR